MNARFGGLAILALALAGCAHRDARTAAALAEPPPPGWRVVSSEALQDPRRVNSPSRYTEAIADFNGDGIADRAFVLMKTSYVREPDGKLTTKGEGILVYLSNGLETPGWFNVSETFWGSGHPDEESQMGIDVIPPGEYQYTCVVRWPGEICRDDNHGTKTFKTDLPSIGYFRLGSSASSFFCWDKRLQHFVRVWRSQLTANKALQPTDSPRFARLAAAERQRCASKGCIQPLDPT